MGGTVGRVIGLGPKEVIERAAGNVLAEPQKAEAKSTKMQEEEGARMRASRRRGRQLLSDARLNPEGGVQTLGGGSNLG
jgi:hypothetical protein